MSDVVAVRDMTPGDVEPCVVLMNQLGYEMDAAVLADRLQGVRNWQGHMVTVATISGAVAGVVHAFHRPAIEKPAEVVVQSLVVDQNRRGHGIGRLLMDAVEGWAREQGLGSVSLSSHERREDAHAFYLALGYAFSDTSKFFRKILM